MRVRSIPGSKETIPAVLRAPVPAVGGATARAVRIGGRTVSPGEARTVPLAAPTGSDAADAIPVWVAVGRRPGPRVTIVAAPRGFEIAAARATASLRRLVDVAALSGAIVVAPVLRPGGRFAARGQPISDSVAWRFPGDPGGNRRAREAFAVFSELAVGASVLLVITAPEPDVAGTLTVGGNLEDPRVKRLAAQSGGAVAVDEKPAVGSLAAAAAEMGTVVLEVRGPSDIGGEGELLATIERLLHATGALFAGSGLAQGQRPPPPPLQSASPSVSLARAEPGPPPATVKQMTTIRAVQGGLLEEAVAAGRLVHKGDVLARIAPPLSDDDVEIRAPHDAIVLEAWTRPAVRARGRIFLLGRLAVGAIARHRKTNHGGDGAVVPFAASPTTGEGVAAGHGTAVHAAVVHVGWVESVSLPGLGVEKLRAKIDTGARTSALHVTRMKVVGSTEGPHPRPILEVTLPGGSRRGARPIIVRVLVREYLQVKDTSGRSERRPVIETILRLGSIERRIRVTLTNRGDMLFPMLIGRTALGPNVVVDPGRRRLNPSQAAAPRNDDES